jgi:S-adenosylmethionine:tRNA ribosyltransferase-isomerase
VLARGALSPRLVRVVFDRAGDELWAAIYREGRPVQYSHLARELPLWAVQTAYAGRPFAFEMPSAGRPLSWEILLGLRRRGVRWAALTHAAGLSATGDPALDAALPLPERYVLPAATVAAVEETRARGGRVIAVGTTVVRALEGAAARGERLRAGPGITGLRLSPAHRRRVVDGILSGVHAPGESHFELLGAFADLRLLRAAHAHAQARGLRPHELGDAMLILPSGHQLDVVEDELDAAVG